MQTFCGLTTDGMYDYLAAIYKLGLEHEKVTTSALAEMMHVSPAAASSMLKRLEESGLIDRSSSEGILLLEQGRLAALQLIRRHRLLEVFLIEIMDFTWDQVEAEAHRLEHSISSEFEERMDRLCNFPVRCPHGDLIPRRDGSMPPEELTPILALQPGQQAILRRVGTNDAGVLRYLSRLSLMPGQRLRLIDRAPFNGPVTLEIVNHRRTEEADGARANGAGAVHADADEDDMGGTVQILGNELADRLFVSLT